MLKPAANPKINTFKICLENERNLGLGHFYLYLYSKQNHAEKEERGKRIKVSYQVTEWGNGGHSPLPTFVTSAYQLRMFRTSQLG